MFQNRNMEVSKEAPKILPCLCKHEYQDRLYGYGRRVHNPTEKQIVYNGHTKLAYRCTVCLNERGI